jgi:Fic family protein
MSIAIQMPVLPYWNGSRSGKLPYLRQSGVVVGTMRHFPDAERLPLVVDLISTEALKTSEIEGELLDRDSVQSSLRRQFGLQTDARRVQLAEQGISQMLSDLYQHSSDPVDHATLFRWPRGRMGSVAGCRQAST